MQQKETGLKIRKLRKQHGDTLQQLAAKVGYDYSNLSKVERGTYGIQLELLKKIIEVYQVDPSYFFGTSFTPAEGDLLLNEKLDPSELKREFNFEVDGLPATKEELEEAIRLVRYFREGKS